jgi:hypothetical protein
MTSLARFSKGLIAAGVLLASGLGLAGCGPDYALFKLSITASSPREAIDHCSVSVTDENGKCVLNEYRIPYGPVDGTGSFVQYGCFPAMTPSKVGDFSFSTSHVKGTFTFQVNAYNANSQIEQSVKSQPVAAKPYPPEMPAIGMLTQSVKDGGWNSICNP